MKIVLLDAAATNPGDLSWERFEALGDFTAYPYTAPEQVLERCSGAEILLTNKTAFPREIIERLEGARYIGLLSTGYNIIDLEAANKRGITVCNVPDYSTEAVAQHTFSLLLGLTNQVQPHSDAVHGGQWSDPERFCFWLHPLTELSGKTFGIIGYGNIGKRVAQIAQAFGMQVLVFSRRNLAGEPVTQGSLEEIFRISDVISFHCSLNEQTRELGREEWFRLMKPTAFLLNTSRGGVICEEDLAKALNEGWIAGAALDVLSQEPPAPDNPLLTARNCLITPHIAWAATQTRARLLEIAADNLEAFIRGNAQNVVES